MKNELQKSGQNLTRIALSLGAAFGVVCAVHAATDLANEPLATQADVSAPNVMFILDDSGSMAQDYTPDYVEDTGSGASCFDGGDDSDGSGTGTITGSPDRCQYGDPPYNATEFNSQYYNPSFWYRPAAQYTGDDMENQSCTFTGGALVGTAPDEGCNTSGWTAVLTNPFQSTSTTNLRASFPDRMWCYDANDNASSTFPAVVAANPEFVSNGGDVPDAYAGTLKCRLNSSYDYPNALFKYAESRSGGPYYYRIQATEYCTDNEMVTCVAATGPTNVAGVDYSFPAYVRHCTDATYTNCQRKRIGSYTVPKYLGTVTGVAARAGEGSLTINSGGNDNPVNISQVSYSGINLLNNTFTTGSYGNGVSVTSGVVTASTGTNSTNERNDMAEALRDAINNNSAASGFCARVTNNVVTIRTGVFGATNSCTDPLADVSWNHTTAFNGVSAAINANVTVNTQSRGQITVGATSTSWNLSYIRIAFPSTGTTPGPTVIANPGTRDLLSGSINSGSCDSSNSNTNRNNCAQQIVNAINSGPAAAYVTATRSGNNVLINADNGGATWNNSLITWSLSGGTISASGPTGSGGCTNQMMCLGVNNGATNVTQVAIANGQDSNTQARSGVGSFTRTNIATTEYCTTQARTTCVVQAAPSATHAVAKQLFPKAEGRIDCTTVNDSCTYEEEMTNFANWYAYYRNRMLMMKSAAGRAFVSINAPNYRVGFITINPTSSGSVQSGKYLKIDYFTGGAGGHKEAWYNKFYGVSPTGGTPLREALSRVGQLFAGRLDDDAATYLTYGIPEADDPLEKSCQPNFAILSTDGYWTSSGNAGRKMDNTDMDDQDNDATDQWSKREDGVYDGNLGSTAGNTAGSASTLADIALHYYKNDLRTTSNPGATNPAGVDVTKNNVPQSQRDNAPHQHMVTFTLGLGLEGALTYRKDYDDPGVTSGDFYRIKSGASDCAATGGGTGTSPCNWPQVTQGQPTTLDDLWHTAVNGRGVFFSAKDPDEVQRTLTDTLDAMKSRIGAGAAAATSNLQPISGDNFAFTAQYQTQTWTGDLSARTIDPATALVSNVVLWSAANELNAKGHTDRVIFTYDPADTTVDPVGPPITNGNKLKHLCWPGAGFTNCSDGAGLDATEQAYFATTQLDQYTPWNGPQKTAATAETLVNYFRGDTTNEQTGGTAATDLYRARTSLLGDIVNAQPSYVKTSPFSYSDAGYSAFKACTEGTGTACGSAFPSATPPKRKATVYAAANDGMLHAFEVDVNNNPYYQNGGIGTATDTTDDTFSCVPSVCNVGNGGERWAYAPRLVMPELYKLANDPYNHQYFVDGSPVVADICLTVPCGGVADWRTMLVGGLNNGGRGYYALDVTNPVAPKALWEFGVGDGTCHSDATIDLGAQTADCHVGKSYGTPVVTKRKTDGKWVVLISSGYNNVSPGDGRGYLYVLEAATGKILKRILVDDRTSGAATIANPSGFAKFNVWIDQSAVNNTALAVYGGDLLGNLWRVDLDSASAGYNTAFKLTVLQDAATPTPNTQPITTRPELGFTSGFRVVLVGTGKYLGNSDNNALPATKPTQTFYGLRDDLSTTPISGRSQLQSQTLGAITDGQRTTTTDNDVDWSTKKGWYVDLPENGERVSVDPQLRRGTILFASNVPDTSDSCAAGGFGLINFLDYTKGTKVDVTGSVASFLYTGGLIVGFNFVVDTAGNDHVILTGSDTGLPTKQAFTESANFGGSRISWRELIYDR
jgi:type IV pilus assembly protein PilY1